MAWHGAVGDVGWALANRDRFGNAAAMMPLPRRRARVPEVLVLAQMLEQFSLEDAATLHKETAIDGFVRHVQVSIARKGVAKPAGDLLR